MARTTPMDLPLLFMKRCILLCGSCMLVKCMVCVLFFLCFFVCGAGIHQQADPLEAVFIKVDGLPRPFVSPKDVADAVQQQCASDMLHGLQVCVSDFTCSTICTGWCIEHSITDARVLLQTKQTTQQGLYRSLYGPHGNEIVAVRYAPLADRVSPPDCPVGPPGGPALHALKITGDVNVPRGNLTFVGDVSRLARGPFDGLAPSEQEAGEVYRPIGTAGGNSSIALRGVVDR